VWKGSEVEHGRFGDGWWRMLPDDTRGLLSCAGSGICGGFAAIVSGAFVLGMVVCALGAYAAAQYDDAILGRRERGAR